MASKISVGGLTLTGPKALSHAHDKAGVELTRAMLHAGPVANAAERLVPLCLSHFEYEEKTIFPVLALLPYLAGGQSGPPVARF